MNQSKATDKLGIIPQLYSSKVTSENNTTTQKEEKLV